jgi:SPP1 gp7 family putative phage head morphogenesis protein
MKNSAYWAKRFEDLEKSQQKKAVDAYAQIERQYRLAQKELDSQIARWYQRFANNNEISLADARKWIVGKDLAEFKWDVDEYIKYGKENAINQKWMKQLENASARVHISRLEALKLQTQQSMEKMFGNQLDTIDSAMKDIYTSGYYHTAYEIQKGVEVGWNFSTLDENQISKVINSPWAADGKNFSERIWGNREKLVNELNTTLTQNIMLGEDPQKAIDAIAKKMGVSKRNAGRLVMTEKAYFSSVSQGDAFWELDVEQYQVLATLDSHTSEICRELDGKIYPMADYKPGDTAPPFHVYCRSTTVPYFDEDFDVPESRAARGTDGKTYYVPGNMTYREWEKSFVEDGSKSGLQEVKNPVEYSENKDYTVRTKEQLEAVANSIKAEITNYSNNVSKWSGNIKIDNGLFKDNAQGAKEWSCDIALVDNAGDDVIWHEMLHSCSCSYYSPETYKKNKRIEESAVEYLGQQICKEKNIDVTEAYKDWVDTLKMINYCFGYGTDMEFSKEIFNVPLPERYQWLEDKVDDSLRKVNAPFEDYNEIMAYVARLKGGSDD